MDMKLTIDQESDAAYVYLTDRGVVRTRELDENRLLDLDDDGEIRGIEFLNVSHGVDLSGLPHAPALADLFRGHGIREFA